MNNPLCIWHGNCADGFTAAWAVHMKLGAGNVDFHAGVYQNPPPDVTGRDVILVDFSYKSDVILEMATKARSLLILDHHKSAAEDLSRLPRISSPAMWDEIKQAASAAREVPVAALFDMSRSGAGIAWDFFHQEPRPRMVDHVEDRDLWKFAISGTREIQAAIFSYPYDFDTWSKLALDIETDPHSVIREGKAIERKHHKDIDELVAVVTRPMKFRWPPLDGPAIQVPMANLPYTLTSDAGALLCGRGLDGRGSRATAGLLDHPFAGCYWDTPEGRVFSLRSREGGADVSEIAKLYGGGGHKNASGFRVPFDQLAQFEP